MHPFASRVVILFIIEKGVANVVRTRSSGRFVIAGPRWRGLVRRPVQLRRTEQYGSPGTMTDDRPIP